MSDLEIVEFYDYKDTCPSQFEGKLADGTWFYARFRGNRIRIGFGATPGQALDSALGTHKRGPFYLHEPEGGDPHDGFIEWGDMLPHVMAALERYRGQS